MRLGRINYLIGQIIALVGVFMLLPLICSLIYGEGETQAFAISASICVVLGSILAWTNRHHRHETMRRRDGFLFAACVWLSAALMGSLPLFFSGCFESFAACFFESMSGFTTTGATACADVESLPHGILLWRSLSHWLGGAGIVLIFVALFQQRDDKGESVAVFNAEFSGGTLAPRISPRIEDNAKAVFGVYVALTLLCFIFLIAGKLSFFDSANHAMSTVATGGFSTKNASIAAFDSAYVEWVVSFFMIASGINFGLIYLMVARGKIRGFFANQELRLYLLVVFAASLLLAITLAANNTYPEQGFAHDIQRGVFQAASIITTTGFSTADYDLWPGFARCLMIMLMLAGGCAGSTAGSVKMSRWFVAVKSLGVELAKVCRPHAVKQIYYNGKTLPLPLVRRMTTYFFLYFCLGIGGALLLAICGMVPGEAIAAAFASLGNIGPAIGSVGPAGSYELVSVGAQWIMSFLMLAGRLELFTVLVLFLPGTWKK